MNAVIVTGGSVDAAYVGRRFSEEAFALKIASDSGMNFYYQSGITPDLIVGDFDSADPAVLAYYEKQTDTEICRLNPIKDDTDTEHAIRTAIERGADSITIFGATGTRLDHVLGNISLLGIGLEAQIAIYMEDPYNRIRLIDSGITIQRDRQFGRFVSLIPYAGEVTGVTLTGMKYPLSDYTMGGFNSLGVSNEIEEDFAGIELRSGYLLVIESRDRF